MASTILSQANDTIEATGNALTYIWGQCTRFVAETLGWVPGGLGNAYQWLSGAQERGLQTGSAPAPGAVAVWGQAPGMPFGHVAVVEQVIPGGIRVREENFVGSGITDVRDVTGSALSGIQGFIYPPGGAGGLPNPFQPVADAAAGVAGLPGAIAGLPASIGHGLANATAATVHDLSAFFKNQIVALAVAAVVVIVIFSGGQRDGGG